MSLKKQTAIKALIDDAGGKQVLLSQLEALELSPGWRLIAKFAKIKAQMDRELVLTAVRSGNSAEEISLNAKYHSGRADGLLFVVEKLVDGLREAVERDKNEST